MQMIQQFMQFISTHSLTRRLTAVDAFSSPQSIHFNSQPHEEADVARNVSCLGIARISTHSLTRRLTLMSVGFSLKEEISTHSLTRRLTLL